jgi:hypothetical protein
MIILDVYFVQSGTIPPNEEKWMKVGWKKSKHNTLSFLKTFSCHITYVHVV